MNTTRLEIELAAAKRHSHKGRLQGVKGSGHYRTALIAIIVLGLSACSSSGDLPGDGRRICNSHPWWAGSAGVGA